MRALAAFLLVFAVYFGRWTVLFIAFGLFMHHIKPSVRRRVPKTVEFCGPTLYAKYEPRVMSDNQELNSALRSVIDHVKKAYITGWYSQISPYNSLFGDQVDAAVTGAFSDLQAAFKQLDWPQFVVGQILPTITKHMQSYSMASASMKRSSQVYTRLSETDALQNRIASFYDKYSPLHPQVNNLEAYVEQLAEKLGPLALPPELLEYPPSCNFIRSLLGNSILLPLCNLLVNPDFWNQQIVKVVEKALQDNAKVSRLRKRMQLSLSGDLPPMTPTTDEEGFQEFISALLRVESVALARQTHYTVSLLLQRLQHSNITSQEFDTYVKRLSISKNTLEDHIKELDPHSLAPKDMFAGFDFNSVLSDPDCVPLFAEFMNCQPFDYLKVFQQLSGLDTSSVDPLGGIEMENAFLSAENKNAIISIYNSLTRIYSEVPGDIMHVLETFADDPTEHHYMDVQRTSWRIRNFLFKTLERFMPEFKNSVYFDQYMAVAGSHKMSVDRLQTDDITVDTNDINHELVHKEVQDAIGEEPADSESQPGLPEDIQILLDNNTHDFKTKIEVLNDQITQLDSQIDILRPLLDKAELTNDVGELHILRKSTSSLEREKSRKILLKDQLTIRSSQSSFYTNFEISITGHTQNTDNAGEYTSYVICVHNKTNDDEWTIHRRYRQFYALHKIIRGQFNVVDQFKFPKKKMVLKFQQRQFVEMRVVALNSYIALLLDNPDICESLALRMFLTSESFPGSYFDYAPSEIKTKVADDDEKGFTQPIAEAFLTLFNIDEKTDWIRGKAIVIVIQQILGGTIEKRIRDIAESVPRHIPGSINMAVENIWPDTPRVQVQRTLAERINSRDHARLLLKRVTKAWLGRIVGVSKCDFASDMVLGMLQNSTLNRHLILSIFDHITTELVAGTTKQRDDWSAPSTPVL